MPSCLLATRDQYLDTSLLQSEISRVAGILEKFSLDFLQSGALCEKVLLCIFHLFFHEELLFADCTIDRGTPCALFAIKYHAWNHVCRNEIVISCYVNELLTWFDK